MNPRTGLLTTKQVRIFNLNKGYEKHLRCPDCGSSNLKIKGQCSIVRTGSRASAIECFNCVGESVIAHSI